MTNNNNTSETNDIWWRERDGSLGSAQSLHMTLLHREQSPFQLIEIYDHKAFGRILVLDGYIQASEADEFIYHEMAMHVPLLGCQRSDTNVLIIGGGEGGALREALKHDFVKSVTMVEIDQRVIDLSAQYLGVNGDYNDPRAQLCVENAADFAARALNAGDTYDIILLDLTEPVGPSAGLFTKDFCMDVIGLLAPNGVIVDSDSIFLSKDGGHFLQEESAGGENLVNLMLREKLLPHVDMYRTTVPLYPGADFGFFLYSHNGQDLSTPARHFEGRHYNPDIHKAAFALPNWQKHWRSNAQ